MFKIIKIPKKLIRMVNKDMLKCLSELFNKKISNQDDIFNHLRKNPEMRPQVFDILNMLPALSHINFQVKEIIEKKISKKFLINWTYPQIRLDDVLSKKFSAPAHKDRWIIDKHKKGYIAWIPLKKSGSSLLIVNKEKTKKNVLNNYWGIEAIGPNKFSKKKIDYGNALIFDPDLLHKSDSPSNSRITLQLRYEEIKPNNFRRSVTQKVDTEVLKYWKKNLL
jgi:hypothetical protein